MMEERMSLPGVGEISTGDTGSGMRDRAGGGCAAGDAGVAESLQSETLRIFVALSEMGEVWSGRLVLSGGFGGCGMGFALAVVAAGGACLTLEADAVLARRAGQVGASDFTVATLSEALRILKNEIRKGLPVSVAVHGAPNELAEEMLLRGVQPDFVGACVQESYAIPEAFFALGAQRVDLPDRPAALLANGFLAGWRWIEDVSANPAERRVLDQVLAAAFDSEHGNSAGGPVRKAMQRWLRVAPRLFPRDRSRAYYEKVTR